MITGSKACPLVIKSSQNAHWGLERICYIWLCNVQIMRKLNVRCLKLKNAIDDDHVKALMLEHHDVFYILMGKHPPSIPFQ